MLTFAAACILLSGCAPVNREYNKWEDLPEALAARAQEKVAAYPFSVATNIRCVVRIYHDGGIAFVGLSPIEHVGKVARDNLMMFAPYNEWPADMMRQTRGLDGGLLWKDAPDWFSDAVRSANPLYIFANGLFYVPEKKEVFFHIPFTQRRGEGIRVMRSSRGE